MLLVSILSSLNRRLRPGVSRRRNSMTRSRRSVAVIDSELLETRALLAANIGATNVDSLVTDMDGDGVADPGDTLQHQITITNSGTSNGTGVTLNVNEDSHTTLVGGSIKITPIAFDDAYALTGNTPITIAAGAGVLANDIDPDASTPLTNVGLTAVSLNTTGTQGAVTLNTNGSFTYTPAAGFTGMDTFQYTARDADSLDSVVTGTVTMTVSGLIWYVDSAAAGGGDGSFNAPFQTLVPLNGAGGAGDVDAAGHTIFVYESGSTYTDGIELENTQLLIGESVGLTVNGMTIGGSGSNPTIATGAAANDVALASGNTVRGLTLGNSGGSALVGTSFGTLVINTVTISANGQALNLNTGAFAGGAAFTSITSTGGTNNVNLTGVTGTVDLGSGALSGASGTAFLVSGGTVSSTYSGNISKSSAGLLIDIDNHETGTVTFQTGTLSSTGSSSGLRVQNSNSGTVNFNNPTKTLNTGANSAVTLNTNNSGGTMNFGGGGLDIDTTSATGFSATGGGTINVTGTNNSITTTAGAAINVANTTIGASDLNFRSITSTNAAADAISLSSTGTTGGLKVGAELPGTPTAGDGGTITNPGDNAISLVNTSNNFFRGLLVNGTGGHGVVGTGMSDGSGSAEATLEFRNSRFTSPGDADNESGLFFGTTAAPANNTGSIVLTDVIVEQFEEQGFEAANDTGSLTISISGTPSGVTNSTTKFDDNNDTHGQSGILVVSKGTASMTVNVTGVYFNNMEAEAIMLQSSASTSSIDVNLLNNISINGGGPDNFPSGGGFAIVQDANGSATFDIKGNNIRDLQGDAIVIIADGPSEGRIGGGNIADGNVISGTLVGDGIRIDTDQLPANGNNFTVTILIQNNQIGSDATFPGIGDDGIQILHRDGTKTLNLTIENNTIANTASEAIRHFQDADVSDGALKPYGAIRVAGNTMTGIGTADAFVFATQETADLDLHVTGNTFPAAGNRNILLTQTGASVLQITQASLAALAAVNTDSTASSTGTITFNSPVTNPPLPGNALRFTTGGVVREVSVPHDEPASSLPTPGTEPVAEEGGPAAQVAEPQSPESPTTADDGVLSHAELTVIVEAAIERWQIAGLSDEQLAVLRSAIVEVSDMTGWYLGMATTGRVRIDSNAGGFGWFIDSTPLDDSEFGSSLSDTRFYTSPSGAPAGRIDLLTTVMHELGHQLGLEDTYLLADQNSLMYGYATLGERRLPAVGQADGVAVREIEHEEYLIGPLNLGTLPAGKAVAVRFNVAIQSLTNGLAPTLSNQGTVSGSNFANVLTDDPAVGGAADPTNTTLDSLTLGNQIWIDADGNSVFNSGTDTGANAAALTLFLSDGTTVVTTGSTNGSGVYQFTGLLPGDYIVRVDSGSFGVGQVLDGKVSITGSVDPDDNVNNDDNGVDNAAPATNGIRTLPITLAYNTEVTAGTGNDTNNTLDLGFAVPMAHTPSVTNASTTANVQTTSGLVISRNAADGAEVTHFKITSITGGLLFQNDGTTAIAANEFITFAQGNAGLKFTPSMDSLATGHFTVQASTSNVDGGLGGSTVTANITVTLLAPVITGPPAVTPFQRPTVTWTGVSGADRYQLWFKNQSTNVNPFLQVTRTSTAFYPSSDLGIGMYNLWIRSGNLTGQFSEYSPQYNFRITTQAIFNNVILYQTTTTPTLNWAALAGATKYDLWINNLSTGQQQFVRDSNLMTNSWTAPNAMPMGSYRAWVRGLDAGGVAADWSAFVNFNVLPAVSVIGPNGSLFDRTPTFSWNSVPGAAGYDVTLRNADTGAIVSNPTNIVGTSYTQPTDLPIGSYRWQVLAVSSNGQRSQSATTQNIFVGGRPTLLTPTGTTSDTTPTFNWTAVAGVGTYELYVTRTDVLTGGIINQIGLVTTTYTPVTPLPVGTYRAWVRAVSSTAELSPWSIQVDFTITADSAEQDSVVPLDGALLARLTAPDLRGIRTISATEPEDLNSVALQFSEVRLISGQTTESDSSPLGGNSPTSPPVSAESFRGRGLSRTVLPKDPSEEGDAAIDAMMAELIDSNSQVWNL